jgi:predicted nucleic acid-binding protein
MRELPFPSTFRYGSGVLPKVYIETSVVSYLTARPSRDIVTLGHQQVTRDWWERDRSVFELYTSEVVIAEAERGDSEAARARIAVLNLLPRLSPSAESEALVPVLLRETRLPADALLDMSHISIATVHGMQFLLTWNCRHIANARIVRVVEKVCRERGFEPPVLCTPEELLGA